MWHVHNSTPIFVSGHSLQVCPAALPETSIYASGRVMFALPEGAGCGPNFCRRLADVTSCFCRRWPKFMPETRVKYGLGPFKDGRTRTKHIVPPSTEHAKKTFGAVGAMAPAISQNFGGGSQTRTGPAPPPPPLQGACQRGGARSGIRVFWYLCCQPWSGLRSGR